MKWRLKSKFEARNSKLETEDIVELLLRNRGISTRKQREEFFGPRHPSEIGLNELGIDEPQVKKVIKRLSRARANREGVVVYGDYDADGICATAIMWEALYGMGIDAIPYIPDRFEEGYGINARSVEKLQTSKTPNIKLVVTVDNGIVAQSAINSINQMGVDVIVTDHHQKGKKLPEALAVVHTTQISGSALAWIVANRLQTTDYSKGLDLVAIGSIADQMPVVGLNRSFIKHGLAALNKTDRVGLLKLMERAGVAGEEVGMYGVGFVIAPRINAMGRVAHGMDSLRLLCTKSKMRAEELVELVESTNIQRQAMVTEMVESAVKKVGVVGRQAIVVADDKYHEGVIGLIASSLVERYHRPAIVISRGEQVSKASARSISGVNIVEEIRAFEHLLVEVGGHPMAAGFSVKTEDLAVFAEEFVKASENFLGDEVTEKTVEVDMEVGFDSLSLELLSELDKFEPTGIGNPRAVFVTSGVEVLDGKLVGSEMKHLKLYVRQGGVEMSAIAFNMGHMYSTLTGNNIVDIAYNLELNEWNGRKKLELKVKDLKHAD